MNHTIYLLALVLGTLLLILLLNYLQRSVLEELNRVLYTNHNPIRYLRMLESGRLRLVFRKGTLLLLKLNGYLTLCDDGDIMKLQEEALHTRMNKNEILTLNRKLFHYYMITGQSQKVPPIYETLKTLLAGETDAKLKEILENTTLLYGHSIEKDKTT